MDRKAEEELSQRRAETQQRREQVKRRTEQVSQRDERMEQVSQRVNEVEKRLTKDSHTSSLPPSSDRCARRKQTRSLRTRSGKQTGGQTGHPGATLVMSEHPETVIPLPVTTCQHGQADLTSIAASSIACRHVVDVPGPQVQLTEDQAERTPCPHCQSQTRAAFPAGVQAPVHSGPRVGTMAP